MNEPDTIFDALRDLPSPRVPSDVRASVLRRAQAQLRGSPEGGQRLAWSSALLLPAVLLACEAVYVAHVVSVLRAVFG